jgi:hypothetical protein
MCNETLVLKSQTTGQPVSMLLGNSVRLSTLDLLQFQLFWDVTLSSWASVLRKFKLIQCLPSSSVKQFMRSAKHRRQVQPTGKGYERVANQLGTALAI